MSLSRTEAVILVRVTHIVPLRWQEWRRRDRAMWIYRKRARITVDLVCSMHQTVQLLA